ncbi:MAG: GGDEF domain-containing protein [Myxococcales bacterium]
MLTLPLSPTRRELLAENARLRDELAALRSQAELAYRDALTGLYNRRHFEERLAQELALSRRTGRPGSLLVVDLDDFKRVNDERGHLAGDEVLRQVASFLRAHLRTEDVICRTGGDEFAVLLPQTDESGVLQLIQRLRDPLSLEPERLQFSLGFASWPRRGLGREELMHAADAAMYEDKRRRKQARVLPLPKAA